MNALSSGNAAAKVKLPETLLTVQEIANHLRLKLSWVYEHADELGAYWLGKYLRFALPRVMERLERGGSVVSGSLSG